MILEGHGIGPRDGTRHRLRNVDESTLRNCRFRRIPRVQTVWLIRGHTYVSALLVHTVTVVIIDRRVRTVDRQLAEVWTAQAADLGVEVREKACLQKGIACDVNTWDQMAWVESDLLRLFKKVPWIFV